MHTHAAAVRKAIDEARRDNARFLQVQHNAPTGATYEVSSKVRIQTQQLHVPFC